MCVYNFIYVMGQPAKNNKSGSTAVPPLLAKNSEDTYIFQL